MTCEKPILFSGEMVRAILDGRKTQTRRVVRREHIPFVHSLLAGWISGRWSHLPLPYGRPGDQLWVRETWLEDTVGNIRYRATERAVQDGNWKWRPSIFMPRWASRISLEVTAVRVERVRDISEEDARAEGVDSIVATDTYSSYRMGFRKLWDSINAKRGYSWESNPWVWVVEFKRVGAL